jgi:phosphomevalonate kinase
LIASAPGKLVLSGAYVVLDGAPAIVAAVGRFAIANTDRSAAFVSEELRAAFGGGPFPHVDTTSMRSGGRKLGLGSSAAALVSSIAAAHLAAARQAGAAAPVLDEEGLDTVERRAFDAHRKAQGGGSGVDVVACTRGGFVLCTIRPDAPPAHRAVRPPPGLVIEAWICPQSASTPGLLGPVRALRAADRRRYDALVGPARDGASETAAGFEQGDAARVLAGARAQLAAMIGLGDAVGSPIIPPYLRALDPLASACGGLVAQAGAGGGDVALYLGSTPSPEGFHQEAARLGLTRLPLLFGAPGAKAGYPALPAHAGNPRPAPRLSVGLWRPSQPGSRCFSAQDARFMRAPR